MTLGKPVTLVTNLHDFATTNFIHLISVSSLETSLSWKQFKKIKSLAFVDVLDQRP